MESNGLTRPGLYFTCKCRNADCSQRGKSALVYVGVGKEFLFTESWKDSKCVACGGVFGSVSSVGFFRCRWTYNGVVEDGSEVREPNHFSYGFTLCIGPKRHRWRSLFLGAYNFTPEELHTTQVYIFNALESPLGPCKRHREVDLRDQREGTVPTMNTKEGSSQTVEESFSRDKLKQLLFDLTLSEQVLKHMSKEVRRKEEKFEQLRRDVEALETEVAVLKRGKRGSNDL